MEVTQANFEEVLPRVLKSISDAKYLSIDCEFSVLPRVLTSISDAKYISIDCEFSGSGNGSGKLSLLCLPDDLYERTREFVESHSLMQVGLCCVYGDVKKQGTPNGQSDGPSTVFEYEYDAYNFYVFPGPLELQSKYFERRDLSISVQPAAFRFLSCQGFDFNKWIGQGINFLPSEEAQQMKEEVTTYYQNRLEGVERQSNAKNTGQNVGIPDKEKPYINALLRQVQEFLDDSTRQEMTLASDSPFVVFFFCPEASAAIAYVLTLSLALVL